MAKKPTDPSELRKRLSHAGITGKIYELAIKKDKTDEDKAMIKSMMKRQVETLSRCLENLNSLLGGRS